MNQKTTSNSRPFLIGAGSSAIITYFLWIIRAVIITDWQDAVVLFVVLFVAFAIVYGLGEQKS